MRYTPEDFETIYRATVTQVSKHVFFKVQNLQDAQDLVQDVYYDLYKHMTSCTEKIENPQAYLIQMANNQLTTYYRDKLRRPVTIIDDEIDLIE
jgi:RNA polymerase sigma factor (sigma-70 family)